MEFNIKESDIIKLIMVYLKDKGIYESLCSLALESNVSIGKSDEAMLYLQKLILQGRWENVKEYLNPAKELYPHLSNPIDYIIQRQKYLEMLSWQGGGSQRMAFPPLNPMLLSDKNQSIDSNIEMNVILAQLNILKSLCSTNDFNALCAFLTLERLNEHPQYLGWTVSQGRYQCFIELRNILYDILPGENDREIPITNISDTTSSSSNRSSQNIKQQNGLLTLIAMSLAYQTALATNRTFYDKNEPQNASLYEKLGYILPNDLIHDKSLHINRDNFDENTPKIILKSPLEYLNKHDQKIVPYRVQQKQIDNNQNIPIKYDDQHIIDSSIDIQSRNIQIALSHSHAPYSYDHSSDLGNIQSAHDSHINIQQLPHPPQQTYQVAPILPVGYTAIPTTAAVFTVASPSYMHIPSIPIQHSIIGVNNNPNIPNISAPYMNTSYNTNINETSSTVLVNNNSIQQTNPSRLSIEVNPIDIGKQEYMMVGQNSNAANVRSVQSYNSISNCSFTPNTHPIAGYIKTPMQVQQLQQHSFQSVTIPPSVQQNIAIYDNQNEINQNVSASVNSQIPVIEPLVSKIPVAPAVAWTLDVKELAKESDAYQELSMKEPNKKVINITGVEVSSTAFTVVIEDSDNILKPMPIALRKKMLADQNAAAIMEENRKETERSTSRGSSSSSNRRGGGGSSRPQSAVRSRGVTSNNTVAAVALIQQQQQGIITSHINNSNGIDDTRRSISAGNVRRNSNNDIKIVQTIDEKVIIHNQPNKKYNSDISIEFKELQQINKPINKSEFKEEKDSFNNIHDNNINQTSNIIPHATYSSYILHQSNCPIRCVASLLGNDNHSNATIDLALGSNAKSIHIISYNKHDLINKQHSANPIMNHMVNDKVVMKHEFKNIHKGSVYTMDWNPDLGLLVSGSNDKALRLSNPINEEVSEYLKGHNGTIRVAKFLKSNSNTNAAYIASAGAGDFMPRLWDVQTGSCVRTLSEHPEAIHGLVWINESMIITGCDQGQTIGHDLRAIKPSWVYNLNDMIRDKNTSGDSNRRGICCLSILHRNFDNYDYMKEIPMIAGCTGGYVTMFDPIKRSIYSHNKLHADDVRSINTIPILNNSNINLTSPRFDERLSFKLLTSSYDGSSIIWNILSNKANEFKFYGKPSVLKGGHTDKVLQAIPIVSHKDGTSDIISTGADGKTILWSIS